MRAIFIQASLILAALPWSVAHAAPEEQRSPNCHAALGEVEVPAARDPSEARAPRLDLGVTHVFDAVGPRWMAAHLTHDGRTLLASLDQQNRLRVFDVDQNLELPTAAPRESSSVWFTRGEWIEGPRGELAVALGDHDGFMAWYGVGSNAERGGHASGIAQPIVPLAVATHGDDGDVYVLVSSGERLYRVRVMPAPTLTHEYRQMNTETRFLRAAHFHAEGDRELIAAISRQSIEVFDLNGAHALYGDDLSSGEQAWTTWFQTPGRDPVLVVTDADLLQLHFPVGKRLPIKLKLDARANGRVHALSTVTGATFVLTPTEAGAEIHRYESGELRAWAKLPTAVSEHQKGIFRGSNDRIYVVWTEEPAGRPPRLNVTRLGRTLDSPEFTLDLDPGERVHHVQALEVSATRQRLFIKTSRRLLIVGPRAAAD